METSIKNINQLDNADNNDINLWSKIVNYLESYLKKEEVNLWLREIKFLNFKNNILEIEIPNIFFQEWMDENCLNLIQTFFTIQYNTQIKVKYKIGDSSTKNNEEIISIPTINLSKKNIKSTLNLKYTFNSFVIGKNNRFAQAACEAVAKDPGNAYNPLFIYGGVGLGKTHLLHAIGNYIQVNNPKMKILYITADTFTNELIACIRNFKNIEFRQKYRTLDVLLIDDIQFITGKERTQEEFFHTFNTLYEAKKQIVMTSDATPKEIPSLEERLVSRLEWGIIADIQSPDYETRIAILQNKAKISNIKVNEEVLDYIASRIKANIRTLEGSLIRVSAFAGLTHTDIDLTLTKQILKDVNYEEPIKQVINIDIIQEITAKHFNITKEDIIGKKRNDTVVLPRQIAIYITREMVNLSITSIGKKFGNRDHTTIMYACNKIREKIKEDPYFSALINKIINEIKNHI
ncbi:MAG: chromosomal replication initiator protein DnaA [Elusimicrobiota bacterium]|nr:chromosomal replication initiator protein DnaA [Elusimicrobiota bacterium]